MANAPVLYPTAALRTQIDRTVADATLSPAARVHELSLLRDELMVLVGECERRMGDANLVRDAGTLAARRDELKARENADLREELIARELATSDELDALGYLSHDQLDRLHEDGRELAETAVGRIGHAFGLGLLRGTAFEARIRRGRGGKFAALPGHPDIGRTVRGGKIKRVLTSGKGALTRAYETRQTNPAALADHLVHGVGDHPALSPAALRDLRRKAHGRRGRDRATRAEIASRFGDDALKDPAIAGQSYEAERGRAYRARAERLERGVGREVGRGTRTDEVQVNPAGRVGQQQLLDFARRAATSPTTVELHATRNDEGDPVFDPDRRQLHASIIQLFLRQRDKDGNLCPSCDPIPSQRKPEVLFTGGGYAAGKSSVLRKLEAEGKVPKDALVLDPDAIKAMLPEFTGTREGDPEANLRVYEEAWAIAQQVQKIAQERRLNVIVDGVSDTSEDEVLTRVESFVRAGYAHPRAVYVDIPTDEAVRRAMKRAVESDRPADKRYIPDTILRAVHRDVAATVPRLLEDPRARSLGLGVEVWDNSGSEPHLMASLDPSLPSGARSGVQTRPTIHAQGSWDRFRAKADERIEGVREPDAPPPPEQLHLPAGALSPGVAPEWRPYFEGEPDAVVPLASLTPTKPPETRMRGVDRAVELMKAAAEGGPRRAPIEVVDNGDGSFTIVDGNATFGAAHRLGLKELPVRLVPRERLPAPRSPGVALTGTANPALAAVEGDVLGALHDDEKGPKPRARIADLDERLKLARDEIQPEVETALDRGRGLAESLGAIPSLPEDGWDEAKAKVAANPDRLHVIIGPVKGVARAREKANTDYGGDGTQVSDLNRATVIVPDLTRVGPVLDGVRDFFGRRGWRIASSKNRMVEATDSNYRDIQLILETSHGEPVELQLQTSDLWLAKEGEGHELYERMRSIQAAATAADRELTPEERRELAGLKARSARLYGGAWSRTVDRTLEAIPNPTRYNP